MVCGSPQYVFHNQIKRVSLKALRFPALSYYVFRFRERVGREIVRTERNTDKKKQIHGPDDRRQLFSLGKRQNKLVDSASPASARELGGHLPHGPDEGRHRYGRGGRALITY
ncbi:hypothetical protein EVAR_102778_1 [Eumeta japonica]|uniref:Uncharacterized protein n=1 Tax=Eumeta variegata TaxID=151549 RepID=A0A4C1TIT2_EUMVA|nr:hypothetical protein EVAR_102778_1 [Eumeta japonica]